MSKYLYFKIGFYGLRALQLGLVIEICQKLFGLISAALGFRNVHNLDNDYNPVSLGTLASVAIFWLIFFGGIVLFLHFWLDPRLKALVKELKTQRDEAKRQLE